MSHHNFLLETLELAKTRRGFCAPNPSVGAIIVRDGNVISKGVTQSPGFHHAEVMALRQLSYPIDNAVLYISLEPCTHWGKTPPCFNEIIKSGIKEVVFAYSDPNPLTKKINIIQAFKEKGVVCRQLELDEVTRFYESYHYWTEKKRPFVTAKIAQSLDGKIAKKRGEPLPLTSSRLALFTHQHRLETDAILTTAETILNDNPKLNVRLNDEVIPKKIVILDRKLRLTGKERIFDLAQSLIVFFDKETPLSLPKTANTEYIPVSANDEVLMLDEVFVYLGERGLHDVWVEVGGRCLTQLLDKQLLNRLYVYIAPQLLGDEYKAVFNGFKPLNFTEFASIHWQVMDEELIGLIDFN